MIVSQNKIKPATYGLALYFLLMAVDCFPIGGLGSALKLIAILPIGLCLLDIQSLRIRINPIVLVQLLFCFLAFLSVFYSVEQDRTITSTQTLVLNLSFVLVLGSFQTYSEAEVKFLRRSMLLGSWLTIIFILAFSSITEDGRLRLQLSEDVWQDPNYINGYMLFTFSFHCNAVLAEKKWWQLLPLLFILGVGFMTGSRGALIAYGAVALVHMVPLLYQSQNRIRNFLALLVVIVIVAVSIEILMAQLPENVRRRFGLEFLAQHGTIGRTNIWKYLWNHFCEDSPLRMLFGHGYGTSSVVNQLNNRVAHNLYLDNLITLGIVGVLLQLVSQFCVMRELIKQKSMVLVGTYTGFIAMCMSLSLVAYKPIWCVMLFALLLQQQALNKKGGEDESC